MKAMQVDLGIPVKTLLCSGSLWPVALKTFCLLPIAGTWTLQGSQRVVDIVLFMHEHFTDSLLSVD